MTKFTKIDTVSLPTETRVEKTPLPELVYLGDPATMAMVDFTQHIPHSVLPTDDLSVAIKLMQSHDVHFLLVRDEHKKIIGLFTSEDAMGERPVQLAEEKREGVSGLDVGILMTPIKQVLGFTWSSIRHARIGNVLATLIGLDQRSALVVSDDATEHSGVLCGMFSTRDISRQLHMNYDDLVKDIDDTTA